MGQDVTKYTYRVRWSEEDEEYLATVAEFPSLSWLEEDQASAFMGIVSLVRDVVEDMTADGEEVPKPLSVREYSGNVRLRMPPAQHRELAIRAAEEGVSLNRLLCSLISRPTVVAMSPSDGAAKGTTDTDEALAPRARPTKSLTVSTTETYTRNGLRLVSSNEDNVKSASGTGLLESSDKYDEWPKEM